MVMLSRELLLLLFLLFICFTFVQYVHTMQFEIFTFKLRVILVKNTITTYYTDNRKTRKNITVFMNIIIMNALHL